MHEQMVANGVVASLTDFAARSGKQVKKFRVVLGELSMFDREIFTDALKAVLAKSGFTNVEVVVEIEPAEIICSQCGSTWTFAELVGGLSDEDREAVHFVPELIGSFASCKRCGSMDLQIISGRGVAVKDVLATG